MSSFMSSFMSSSQNDGNHKPANTNVSANSRSHRTANRSMARRGPTALPKNRGTGFEEYFADPPMTAGEAAEEKLEIYAETVPLDERIQSCIQRFRARRRLQGDQVALFNEYLFMGGVDTSQNSFSGHDPKDLKDLTPAERRQATAIDSVHFGSGTDERFYNGDDAHWSVDFAGVAAGFFSTSFGLLTGFHPQKAEAAINLVENFLRYVLQHGICTEYKDNVESALQVCQQARIEWPMLNQLSSDLPGCFNLAAMELLDKADASDWSFLSFSPPDGFDAKAVFRTACELRGEAATLDLLAKGGGVKARRQHDLTAKVVRIDRPSGTMLQQFAAVEVEGYSNKIDPVGKVFLKRTVIEDEWVRPQQPDPAATPSAEESEFCCWLYLEDCLLENILPGMKMELTVVELITGLWILKTVSRIVPTFYTFLPQQMMRHFKHPRQHDKLAPSANDAAAEEGQAAAEVA